MTKNIRLDHIISAVSYGVVLYVLTRVLWQPSASLDWIVNNLEPIFLGEIFAVLLMAGFYRHKLIGSDKEKPKVSRMWSIIIGISMVIFVASLLKSFQVLLVLGALVLPKVLSSNTTRKSFILNHFVSFTFSVVCSSIFAGALSNYGSFALLDKDHQFGVAFLSLYYSILLFIELVLSIFI